MKHTIPMLVTLLGMVMVFRLSQCSNALFPTLVILSGRSITERLVQYTNA